MTIVFNPNANVVTADQASQASPLALTINGCTAGNTLFLAVCWIDTSSVTGLTPPAAPAGFVTDVSINSAGTSGEAVSVVLYRAASIASGTHAVSLPFTSGAGQGTSPYFWEAALFETTPVALDKAPAAVSGTTTSLTGPNTGTLSSAVEFAVALCGANSSTSAGIPSLPTGFTSILGGNASAAGIGGRIAQQITAVNTALNPSWTASSAQAMAAIVATYTDASVVSARAVSAGMGPGRNPGKTGARFKRLILSTTVASGANINASVGAYSWVGTTSTASGLINAGVGAYSWSGTTSGLLQNISAGVGAYSWIGTTSTASGLIQAGVGDYTWAGTTGTFGGPINASVGAYSWSGTTSSSSELIAAGIGAYSWAGTTATLNQEIDGSAGAYNWSGTTASFTQLLIATTGTYTWAATTGTLGAGAISASPGVYTWSAPDANIPTQISSDPTFGYVWSGITSTLGDQTPPPVPTPSGGGMLPGVNIGSPPWKPRTALELEGRVPLPWQATGAPIVPSPYLGSQEAPPIAIAAPPMLQAEPAIAPTEDEALLLLMLYGASL
jgi:hypothetical protein